MQNTIGTTGADSAAPSLADRRPYGDRPGGYADRSYPPRYDGGGGGGYGGAAAADRGGYGGHGGDRGGYGGYGAERGGYRDDYRCVARCWRKQRCHHCNHGAAAAVAACCVAMLWLHRPCCASV
jgi:hypothetical protein